VSGNNIGEEGAKALGPHLAKLMNMRTLGLGGKTAASLSFRKWLRFKSQDHVFMCVSCHTGNGILGWQQDLLQCYVSVPTRLAALKHVTQGSAWRLAVVRYDRRLWAHLPEEASVWRDNEPTIGDETMETHENFSFLSAPRSRLSSVAMRMACCVGTAATSGDAATALQRRKKAETRQQNAIQTLDRAVSKGQSDVQVAVAQVHAAATGANRNDVDDAVHHRRSVVETAITAVQDALVECSRSGLTDSNVSSCAPGTAARDILVRLRRDAETDNLVQKLVVVRDSSNTTERGK